MLILPLHQPITRKNFPTVTAVLVLVNVCVFLFLQSGDHRSYAAADAYYGSSGLARIEAPLYAAYLRRSNVTSRHQQDESAPSAGLSMHWQQQDAAFRALLARGELFVDAEARVAWTPLAARYDELRAKVFTERFALHADQPRLLTAFSAMFLHGGFEHLLGNMLFLIALGTLVEGPLGPALFAALYLLGGLGAGGVWLLANSGVGESVIGASGAIAALMGAFCVIWGRRQVRFFYWFFVVFDYVKGPALSLLPFWLGWELLQWGLAGGARVAYEAHAGGIVSGALLGILARQRGWQRESYFAESAPAPADSAAQMRQALEHLGRMRLAEAEIILEALAAECPASFEVAAARFRSALLGRRRELVIARARELLRLPASGAQAQEQLVAFGALRESGAEADDALQWALAERLVGAGNPDAAVELATSVGADNDLDPGSPQRWLSLAFRLEEGSARPQARRVLEHLVRRFPDAPQVGKARFLLGEWV